MLKIVLQILFPARCFSCRRYGKEICASCEEKIRRQTKIRKISENVYSLLNYQSNVAKDLIWNLKYKNNISLREKVFTIFRDTLEEIKKSYLGSKNIIYIPVPKNKSRTDAREFDHANLLALEISKTIGGKVISNLIKKKEDHKRQVETRSKKERISNAKNSITLDQSIPLPNNTILCIIDDVLTTGATNEEVRRILKKNYPTLIIHTIVLAH